MIFRSPIFRKLLTSAILLIALTLLALNFDLTRYVARHQTEGVKQRLQVAARLLRPEVNSIQPAELEKWARQASSQAEMRVTIVDPHGVVVADSNRGPSTRTNHADRPEVQLAYKGKVGTSIRHSNTLNRDLYYLAIPIRYQNHLGYVLRLAVPMEEVSSSIWAIRERILWASLLAAVVALAFAYVFSRSLTKRIDQLQKFSEGLAEARFSATPLPIERDELGALARSLNQMSAQLRAMVDRLSVESARRDAILAGMVEGVLAVDGTLRITFCNDSFAHVFGVATPVPEHLPLIDLVRDTGLIDMFNRVLGGRQPAKQRLEVPLAGGRVFEVQVAPLMAPSHRGAIAVLHDVTHLERLERIRKDFVANVSHELRTPLTAIQGYAETLLEGALDDKENSRRFLETIHAHAVRLSNIASDLLTLSELESGKTGVLQERISVQAALESALHAVEPEAQLRGVKLIHGNIEDAVVMGEKLRLEQALLNLLNNAVKFNRPGGEVRAEIVNTPDRRVRIKIIDNGIGIPSTDLSRIFERFYRVDRARSREVGGTGLGLSIVKHIVERMKGLVTVESRLGQGSTFTIFLPIC